MEVAVAMHLLVTYTLLYTLRLLKYEEARTYSY